MGSNPTLSARNANALPGAAYLQAAARNKIDVQYVLTGFRAREVPGAAEFSERMATGTAKQAKLWKLYEMPEEPKLFSALQPVFAAQDLSDGARSNLVEAIAEVAGVNPSAKPSPTFAPRAKTAAPITAAASAVARSVHVNEGLLKDCMAGVETFLHEKHARMSPDNKAALVIEVYGHFLEEEQRESKRASRTNVVEFIRRRAA